MPTDSERSSSTARACVYPWKKRIEMSAATTPARTMPSRKSAGSRTRSDPHGTDPSIELEPTPLRGRRFARGADLVADAPHGDDRRGVAELAAQLTDVDVDRPRVAGERVAPDALEQLVARQHEPAMVEELPQQVELLRRELDLG